MYEMCKHILRKVSFDPALFRKELAKSVSWLKPKEKTSLKKWCLKTFDRQYRSIILEVYRGNVMPA